MQKLRRVCARLSDVEQRVRKKRRHRDFDDEDYEEPIQPRRVSARKSAQARPPFAAVHAQVMLPIERANVPKSRSCGTYSRRRPA